MGILVFLAFFHDSKSFRGGFLTFLLFDIQYGNIMVEQDATYAFNGGLASPSHIKSKRVIGFLKVGPLMVSFFTKTSSIKAAQANIHPTFHILSASVSQTRNQRGWELA
jgi:hypothetical protein